jgi:hypothetical protein
MHYKTERDLLNKSLAALEKVRVDLECVVMVAAGDTPAREAVRLTKLTVPLVEAAQELALRALAVIPPDPQ